MAGNAASVGAVSFDLSLNTGGLTQAINEAARSTNTQLTNAFQSAAAGCTGSINTISNSITHMTSGMQSSFNGIARSMTDSISSATSQITSNIGSSMSQASQSVQAANVTIQSILNSSELSERARVGRIAALYRQQGATMSDAMTRAWSDVRSGAVHTGESVERTGETIAEHFGRAGGQARELGEEAGNTAKSIGSTLTSAVKKLGALIISAFAVKQVIMFSKSCVEAAAQVKALNAQFEQTFGNFQNDAGNAIKSVAKESGILETRLQGVGTQIYAFAKASGMDSVNALTMMQEALQVTADSAAYYDRSIEDAAESLRSFLKGNYANDAALGISCTETTRNAAANKLYGKSFQELSEAQKQLTLLQMVKDANELSGAMGQAAREADGWENVTGNLKEAWKQFKAVIGKPLLQALIPIVKNITSAIQSLTTAAGEAAKALADLFGWDLGEAEKTGGAISDIAESTADSVSDAEEEAQDDIEETIKEQKKAQGQLAGFDKLNVLTMPEDDSAGGDDKKETEKNNDISESAELAESSVDDLKQAIDSVKFDGIKKQIQSLIKFFDPLVSAVKTNIQISFDTAQKGIEEYLDKYGDRISEYSDRIKGHLQNTAAQTANGVTNILNEAAASQARMSDELSTGYAELLGGASIFSLSFADVFTGGLDIVSKNFEIWTIENKDIIGAFFDGLNGNAANAMTEFGGIFEDIGTTLTDWWDNTGSQAFDKLTEAFFDVQTVLLDFWNNYITPFIDYIIDSVGELWDNHLSKLWSGILEFISSLMETVAALWNGFLRPLYDTFIKRIMVGIMGALKSLWDVVCDVVGMIVDVIRGLLKSLQGILDFITGIFTGDMEKALIGFWEFVQGICIMIWGVIKGILNVIIDALNTVWSAIYGVLKSIVDGVGDFVGIIGDLFGKDWGFSMPDEVPRIPRLASGGLVRAPTIAMVGDNKNAYSDPEVVSPLSKLQGMIDNGEADNTELLRQILLYLKMLYEMYKDSGGDINITAELDGDAIFKNIVSRNRAYQRRHGKGAFV